MWTTRGILNPLFQSGATNAERLVKDDAALLALWKEYLGTIHNKEQILARLRQGPTVEEDLRQLRVLLSTGLVDIGAEQKQETEFITELTAIQQAKKLKKIDRLDACLGYAATKYRYVHDLLGQLFTILTNQYRIVDFLYAPERGIDHAASATIRAREGGHR